MVGLPWWVTAHDAEYEDGLWAKFPDDPTGSKAIWVARNVTWWVHTAWWKYGPVDRSGKMQPLHACPK